MEQVTTESFTQEVIAASYDFPVIVQFWAPWCGPCHGLTATLDQIEADNEFPVRFRGLDVDQYTDLALQFKVMGVPHTKVFVCGHVLDYFSDPLPANEIGLFIRNALLLPSILRYSHYNMSIDPDYLKILEGGITSSRRKDVYLLTLARHYFFTDLEKSRHFLDQIPDESDQFEDRLFIQDLYPLMDLEFGHDAVQKKMWAAKNALGKKNFESTYQFLLQANLINGDDQFDIPRSVLLAFHRFLGADHELNRKYHGQFSKLNPGGFGSGK